MVKRKCGTCRHFKDGGIAGSGWCHHPARRELHHMVLVRKTELGCRNNWDQDLWEPASGLAPDAGDGGTVIPDPSTPVQPPATGGYSSTGSAPASAGDMFTDKLTSITMVPPRVRDTAAPEDAAAQQPEPVERSDVRAARRRRLEQLERERQQRQREQSDEARRLLERPDDQPQRNEQAPASQPPSAPRRASDPRTARSEPSGRMANDDEQRRPPERERPRVSPPPPVSPRVVGFVRDESVQFGASPSSFHTGRGTSDRVAERPRFTTEVDRRAPQHKPQPPDDFAETDDLPIAEVRAQTRRGPESLAAATSVTVPSLQEEPVAAGEAIEPPIDDRDPGWRVWAGQIGNHRADDSVQEASSPSAHVAGEIATPRIPDNPAGVRQHPPRVPRCCATCRDFRPVGEGSTGWCANPYAFDEKRMVESSGLACHSSIGCWWLPSDEVWLDKADTTHHSRPTPLLDDLHKPGVEREREMPSHPN